VVPQLEQEARKAIDRLLEQVRRALCDASQTNIHAALRVATRERLWPFTYQSPGAEARFVNKIHPVPRSCPVFAFHMPATTAIWSDETRTLEGVKSIATYPLPSSAGVRTSTARNACASIFKTANVLF